VTVNLGNDRRLGRGWACVSGGLVDDRSIGLECAALHGRFDHAQRHAIFDASPRVQELTFDIDVDIARLVDASQFD
jgi:hypothetical protein